MKTRSVFSEVLFNLSPTKNVSRAACTTHWQIKVALQRIGISPMDTAFFAVLVDRDPSAEGRHHYNGCMIRRRDS